MSAKKAKAARRAARAQGGVVKTKSRAQTPKRYQPTTATRFRRGVWVLLAIPLVVGGLYALSAFGKGGGGGGKASHGSGAYPYAIGTPGPGDPAPALTLPSTSGGTFDLASYRGKAQVLLYFQEGLTCQSCWTQLQAIQKDLPKFRALGIGSIVSITTDPLGDLKQLVNDDGITIPVLSDVGAQFSGANAWGANKYQMNSMMGDRDGHTFILVGKNGRIRWRGDYGGAPKHLMYVPDNRLLADLRQGIKNQA